MLSGNKGEWSEIYALLKIISDKNLFGGSRDLNIIENLIFPIIKILRDGSSGTYEYSYESDLVLIKGEEEEFRIPINLFQEKAVFLLSRLQETTSSTFSIPEIEIFINSFNCTSLKAKSSVKSDIRIVIHDYRTGTTPNLGFSIKSQLGEASTLLNAGKTTNFIYKVIGEPLSIKDVNYINSLFIVRGTKTSKDIRGRLKAIYDRGAFLVFSKNENTVFENNLTLIDSSLPNILAEIVFQFFYSSKSKSIDLVSLISEYNPMKYNMESNHPFYMYKFKRFLSDIALGMTPSKLWAGLLDATGGYLIVKENGEVLCYHIYNRNEFEDYLVHNTKLETASSSRHDFGTLYQIDSDIFFKLNLQIRFLK